MKFLHGLSILFFPPGMGAERVCRVRNKESVKRVYRVQKRSLSISCLQNFGYETSWFLCLEHHLDHGTILEIDRLNNLGIDCCFMSNLGYLTVVKTSLPHYVVMFF